MALTARHWWLGSGWLMLAVILAHALNPTASPLTKSSGSAFNGFTAEVSLGPERGSAPRQFLLGRDPIGDAAAGGARDLALAPAIAASLPLVSTEAVLLPPASDPPPSAPGRAPFQARAPPSA